MAQILKFPLQVTHITADWALQEFEFGKADMDLALYQPISISCGKEEHIQVFRNAYKQAVERRDISLQVINLLTY